MSASEPWVGPEVVEEQILEPAAVAELPAAELRAETLFKFVLAADAYSTTFIEASSDRVTRERGTIKKTPKTPADDIFPLLDLWLAGKCEDCTHAGDVLDCRNNSVCVARR